MNRQTIKGLAIGVVGGAAVVVACSDSNMGIDAGGKADAGFDAQPGLTSESIYRVRSTTSTPTLAGRFGGVASCLSGDVVIGGGCWVYPEGSVYDGTGEEPDTGNNNFTIVLNGPERYVNAQGEATEVVDSWRCQYANPINATNIVADIYAICLDLPDQ